MTAPSGTSAGEGPASDLPVAEPIVPAAMSLPEMAPPATPAPATPVSDPPAPPSAPPDPCDGGVLESGSGVCYRLFQDALPWTDAREVCQGWGGDLVSIESAGEDDFVGRLGGAPVWIGLNDAALDGAFVSPLGQPPSFVNWAPGQPDDGAGVDCVERRSSPTGAWYDERCTAARAFVCERPCTSATCAPASTCSDGLLNGDETSVDCGGHCSTCAPGLDCRSDADCASGACVAGKCCGGTRFDCTRCAEQLTPSISCSDGASPAAANQCAAFLQCLADNPEACSTRLAAGCSDSGGACSADNFGGNASDGVTLADSILGSAGCAF